MKPYQFIFDPIAADEYLNTFNWYEERSTPAADNLIVAVQNGVKAICADPYRYRNTYKKLRELTIKNYLYNLIYQIDENKKRIIVTSLFHHKRNPKKKFDKLKSK